MNSDKVMEMLASLDEAVRQYNKCRALWLEKFNNDNGFNDWFTKQIMEAN